MFKKIIIRNAILILHFICLCQSNNSDNYGEFTLRLIHTSVCKGPKQNECSNVAAKLGNDTNLEIDLHILKDVIPNRGKILASMNKHPLIRLQVKNPCEHLFLKPLFQNFFHATQNCEFKKNHYNLSVNIEDIAQKYYGGMFLYGNLTFKSLFYSDDCNFSCVILEVMSVPKKKG